MARERLQRVIAASGVASRRVAEGLIESGHVQVNGVVVRALPAFADPRTDRITIDGRPLPRPERRVYILLNKPARCMSTAADEGGRTTVLELIDHPARPRLFPVGRLDFHAVGLLLLTNDGPLAQRLTHPRHGVERTYQVGVRGAVAGGDLPALERKLARLIRKRLDPVARARGGDLSPVVRLISSEGDRATLAVTVRGGGGGGTPRSAAGVREGRRRAGGGDGGPIASAGREPARRDLRSLLAEAGLPVRTLERVSMGPLRLTGVARGRWRELDREEVRALRDLVRARVRPETPPGSHHEPRAGERPHALPRDRRSSSKPVRPESEPRSPRPSARPGSRKGRGP